MKTCKEEMLPILTMPLPPVIILRSSKRLKSLELKLRNVDFLTAWQFSFIQILASSVLHQNCTHKMINCVKDFTMKSDNET